MPGSIFQKLKVSYKRIFCPDISIFHTFVKPPYGGGNQFSLALREEFERIGYYAETNKISSSSKACLFNSFNFEFEILRAQKAKRPGCKMAHRVDGPVSVYRGREDGIDEKIEAINKELADITIFQSNYSMEEHKKLGLEFKNPCVIMNACDPDIFNLNDKSKYDPDSKIKLISNSWSDNPNKGGDIYKWIEDRIDWEKYEYTFVGRSSRKFSRIKVIPPVDSAKLAKIMKEHDIYITASRHDPCSNSLIEALSCGLPAVYLESGGHPEIAGSGGEGFRENQEAIEAIETVSADYSQFQRDISVPHINNVASSYLKAMGLSAEYDN